MISAFIAVISQKKKNSHEPLHDAGVNTGAVFVLLATQPRGLTSAVDICEGSFGEISQ